MTWPALRSARSALSLSSIANVLASMMTRGRTRALTMAATVASSATGLGRLVMTVSTAAASGIDVVAHHPPAGGEEVARERAAHDAEADNTDFAFRHCQPPLPIDAAADATRRLPPRSSSMWPSGAARGLCLSRARVIPYGRRPLPQRCGGAGENPQGEHIRCRSAS